VDFPNRSLAALPKTKISGHRHERGERKAQKESCSAVKGLELKLSTIRLYRGKDVVVKNCMGLVFSCISSHGIAQRRWRVQEVLEAFLFHVASRVRSCFQFFIRASSFPVIIFLFLAIVTKNV